MTTSKIKIKLGAIEVEYEGSESFLKEELPALLTAVSDLYEKSVAKGLNGASGKGETGADATTGAASGGANGSASATGAGATGEKALQGTTNTIAQRLQVKSGPELVLAAAARLGIVEKQDTFTRQQLLDEIKGATAYVRATYVNNLTRTLTSMVKDGTFNEARTGHFALSATRRAELEARLAG